MPANLTFDQLKAEVAGGSIDTVLTAVVDMQGRLMGKRFHARHFLDAGYKETHGCNYLLATDLEMETVQGYAATGWQTGYGDYTHKPDLATLRRVPWQPATALVMCDFLDHNGAAEIDHAPRSMLKRQIARLSALGLAPMMATELEFFLFNEPFDVLHDRGYQGLTTNVRYNVDYSLTGTAKEEGVMRAIRNGLYEAGIPVECSKGEAEAGQEEINVRYSDALDTADMHAIVKSAVREIAEQHGLSVTFMAKYDTERAGSSSHVHQSLFRGGDNAFFDPDAEQGMSKMMRHYLAGLLAHAGEITCFLAPYVNSYKRFCTGLFAPTKAVWSTDNRTAGFRVCGAGGKAVRVECRIGGSDLTPHLALAAQLAAGLAGIEQELDLEPELTGDVYAAQGLREVPKTLREAADLLEGSTMLRAAFGDAVVDHYTHAARWEVAESNRVVTDFERRRGFERA